MHSTTATTHQKLNSAHRAIRPGGFTLVELAIVLVIFGLLVSGMMMTLGAQQDSVNIKETEKRLNDIRDGLLGFAASNGRLPCPAVTATTGIESPPGGGACTSSYAGYLPAITLGLTPTNAQGYAIDAWGNPIRYAVTNITANAVTNVMTTSGALKAAWAINPALILPDLRVCNTSTGIAGAGITATCAAGADLTNTAVAVVFSTGKNGAAAPTSADELANSGANRTFVSHMQSLPGSAQGEFDDIVIWLSPNVLYNRLISAGRLP